MRVIIVKQIKAPNLKCQHNVPISRHRILMSIFKRTEEGIEYEIITSYSFSIISFIMCV